MAKKKRQTSSGESPKARQAVQELRDYYQLGLEILAADAENPNRAVYSKGISRDFAERLGVQRDHVDKARTFAEKYTQKQLDALCSLRLPNGTPLSRRHVINLLSVEDKRERSRLQRTVVKEGWSARRLGEHLTAIKGRHSSGGRRPRAPEAVDDALVQIVKMAESWARWYAQFQNDEKDNAVTPKDLPPSVSRELVAATAAIEKLELAAQRQLKRKRSHSKPK